MRLTELANANAPLPLGVLGERRDLVRDVQDCLTRAGLLDPPTDGSFGPVSRWALEAFRARAGLPKDGSLSPALAQALLAPSGAEYFALQPDQSLAGRVLRAMQRKAYWIARHPKCLNIVYLEGCNIDGTANDNAPNQFNDARVVISLDGKGKPKLRGAWEATSEPGRYWTMHPLDTNGAARIAFGQYKAWSLGEHPGTSAPKHHPALVQVAEITVHRDLNEDFKRDGDRTFTGLFGINQHWGYDLPHNDINNASAGCLVGRTKAGHLEFIELLKRDERVRANGGYRFMTTVMPVAELDK